MNIETSITSSAPMSIGTKIGHPHGTSTEAKIEHPHGTSTEAKIETNHAETQIDIVMTTRMRPRGVMTDSLRPPGTAIMRVAGMVESTSGWCSNKIRLVP